MKVTILTYGSRGDVQPFVALALGLQQAGHCVKLAAPHRFEKFVNEHGITFVPLAGDPEVISRRLNDAGTNPIRMVRVMSEYIFSVAGQVVRQAFAACDDADLIVHSFLFTAGGHSLARARNIADVSVQTFPIFAPTHAFPPVAMPGLPPGNFSYFFHWLNTQVFWYGGKIGFRRLQKGNPSVFDLELHWPFRADESGNRTPLLFAYSSTVLPFPEDWSAAHIHIPGYFFLETPDSYKPPLALQEFLSTGNPPVCVSFGSMIHREAEQIYKMVLEALNRTKNRAVILSGWSNISYRNSKNILVINDIPHDWLLPRCRAFIHHGGAGTTAAGLRSAIPSIIVPFAADQPFWGARVHALGAGPKPVTVKKLSTEKLISALVESQSPFIRSSVYSLGRKINREYGVKKAVRLIEAYTRRD